MIAVGFMMMALATMFIVLCAILEDILCLVRVPPPVVMAGILVVLVGGLLTLAGLTKLLWMVAP